MQNEVENLSTKERALLAKHWTQFAKTLMRQQLIETALEHRGLTSTIYRICTDELAKRESANQRRQTTLEARDAWSKATPTQRKTMAKRRGVSPNNKRVRT